MNAFYYYTGFVFWNLLLGFTLFVAFAFLEVKVLRKKKWWVWLTNWLALFWLALKIPFIRKSEKWEKSLRFLKDWREQKNIKQTSINIYIWLLEKKLA